MPSVYIDRNLNFHGVVQEQDRQLKCYACPLLSHLDNHRLTGRCSRSGETSKSETYLTDLLRTTDGEARTCSDSVLHAK